MTPAAIARASDWPIQHGDGLEPYQRVGVAFLASARRAILADDVGLGKTAQALRAVMEVGAERVLVVTKKSLIEQWTREIERWCGPTRSRKDDGDPFPACARFLQVGRTSSFLIINYEQVIRHLDDLLECAWDVLIVDEAAAVRNRKTQRAKAIHKLARRAECVWPLTGTPIHNRPDELWSLLHAVAPKVFSSYWRFVNTHCLVSCNPWGGVDVLGVRDAGKLAQVIASHYLRRTKELLGLPPLSTETRYVALSPEQRRLYSALRSELAVQVDENRWVLTPTILSLLTRLRQVCCSPALLGGRNDSAKTEAVRELLEELGPEQKVLVFTTFAEYARLLYKSLVAYSPALIVGDTPVGRRAGEAARFQGDSSCRVLIGTIGAMGEGLNLQAASIVVFANRDWTPAMNEQAVGRAYRRGQARPVHVVNLVTSGTVEEYVERVLAAK
ncbi:MAG: DEAD/DEAH box helicase, partial [Armatimonadota bacterium]